MGNVPAGDGPTEETSSNGEGIVAFGFRREQFIYDRRELVGLYFCEALAFEFWLEVAVYHPLIINDCAWTDAFGLALEEDGESVFKVQCGIVAFAEGALCEKLTGSFSCLGKG